MENDDLEQRLVKLQEQINTLGDIVSTQVGMMRDLTDIVKSLKDYVLRDRDMELPERVIYYDPTAPGQ